MTDVVVTGIAAGAVYGLFALGLVLVYKATKILNFAQAEIGSFATFVAWGLITSWKFPWLVGALGGLLVAGALGLAFERAVVRPLIDAPRLTLVVATIGMGLLLAGLEFKIWGASPRIMPTPFHGDGLTIGSVTLPPARLLALGLTAAAAGASAWFFRRTTFGLAILAAAQDVVGVRLTGIRLRHLSAFTWLTSSVVGAAAGIIIALSLGAFAPTFLNGIMLLGFAAAVLGGMTSLPGALVGGIVVGITQAVVSHYWISVAGLVETVMFGAIVAVLLLRPRGLLGRLA
ncbi:MAG: branched-chain amino acid ABC transporter permease [Actinobacteria bacterium]|nr:branched-chain amino acid ABC transporter permease [Actinomycetota bacterium]MBV9663165.1 branched-chain amino acid ABC transporter permease [Actinomycetota bacterium]MBV9933087.1 branched-chain amino acid ABC transporter permease [Actinomycetota bacterium]